MIFAYDVLPKAVIAAWEIVSITLTGVRMGADTTIIIMPVKRGSRSSSQGHRHSGDVVVYIPKGRDDGLRGRGVTTTSNSGGLGRHGGSTAPATQVKQQINKPSAFLIAHAFTDCTSLTWGELHERGDCADHRKSQDRDASLNANGGTA
jgi:hypothetical protein